MSRRKQLKPQQLSEDPLRNTRSADGLCVQVCSRCCAEFSTSSDLDQHQTDCSPNPPVLIVNEDLLSCSKTLPAASVPGSPAGGPGGPASAPPPQDRRAELVDRFSSRGVKSPRSCSTNPSISEWDSVLCTWGFPESSAPPDCSADPGGDADTSSLLQQLLDLQIQQIHQLQLIDQIRHQVLLFASHRAQIPETLMIRTKDLLSAKSTNQLKALGARLSQQLAAAAGLAKRLSGQSAATAAEPPNQPDGNDVPASPDSSPSFRELMTTAVREHAPKTQRVDCSSSDSQLGFLSQTKMSSLMFSNNRFITKTSGNSLFPRRSSRSDHAASVPDISEIVEDLDALAALAQRRTCRNLPALLLFKHRCRFCASVFGSDSALRIHLRSHNNSEQPYRCNICGNRFPTRGNLKVHFQRHTEGYPHIQTIMHLVPEQPDNMQTNAETAALRWLDGRTSGSLGPAHSPDLSSVPFPFTQGDLYFDSAAGADFRSKANPTKTSDSAETRQPRTMNLKSEEVKPSLHPNECVVCHRVLSCQSALRMHYRTHTGERPYACKLCSRAFTTKGNLKTHQAVHRAAGPLRVLHSCPVCHRKFTNAAVMQQHVHTHMGGHVPNADRKHYKVFRDKTKLCDNRLSRFKSLSIRLSPSLIGSNLVEKKTSCCGPRRALQLKWIKTERPEGSNEEGWQTNNQPAAGQRTSTCSMSDSSAPPTGRASTCFKTTRLDDPFQTWLDSTTLRASAPADPNFFTHMEDSPSVIHREKGVLKNPYCDICGKTFACQSALDIHYRSHTKERPFVCSTCSRGFSTKGNLKQHMLTHQMRDFPSHLLEPSNQNRAAHHNHSMLSSPAVKREVDLSGHSQSSSVSAVAPPRRTPKQHHCNTCGKSFSSSSALQIHERTHTGERPFACAVCGRAFTTKGNLKVHMGTHMWNSAPSRRGRRLSVDRSSVGFGTRPVKLPEPPQKNPATGSSSRESVHHGSRGLPSAGLKVNDIGAIQSGGTSVPSGGLKETPVENTSASRAQ